MITKLPESAKECALSGIFITPDAKVFKTDKNGFKELKVKADKKCVGKFYLSEDRKYHSLLQAYAEAFVPNRGNKPLAFIKDSSAGLSMDNLMWATNDEWVDFWKANTQRQCKCCGGNVEKDMAGSICKSCFAKMSEAKPDTDEIKRFQERIAATGFNPDVNRFSGRQRDVLELYCSGESLAKIASVLGCDMKTASNCIQSAKIARKLERVSTENVTPIGYKTAADVLPETVQLSSDGSEKHAKSKTMHVLRISKTTKQLNFEADKMSPLANVYEKRVQDVIPEPEEITPDWYNQEQIVSKLPFKRRVTKESGKEALIKRFLSFSIKTIKMCLHLAAKIENGAKIQVIEDSDLKDDIPHNDIELHYNKEASLSDIGVSVQHAININAKESAEEDTAVNKQDHEEKEVLLVVFDKRENEDADKSLTVAEQKQEKSELSILFDIYRESFSEIPFSSFCKVYWIASKYSSIEAQRLTRLVIRYVTSRNLAYDVSTINNVLRAGMEVINGR